MEVKESIWAAGCPQNIREDMKVNPHEMLLMGINFIVKHFAPKFGYQVLQVSDKPNALPNVILKRDNKIYGMAVVAFAFPNYAILHDHIRIEFVNKMREQNVIPLYAPIGFISEDPDRAKAALMLKGDVFKIIYRGFLVLNNMNKQNLMPDVKEFKNIIE